MPRRSESLLKRKRCIRHYSATWPEACGGMDDPMNSPNETPDLVERVQPARRSPMLCSLRIVPVSSEHFLGRRYVMELATTSRAHELRFFRSMEQLMHGVEELGLRKELRESLHLQLLDEGSCELLDILL